ncbi:hypothetical protein FAP59_18260 [Morganella morganii]|nr:hypothetical protein [Morganella morganii]
MENRIAKIEFDIDDIKKDINEMRRDLKNIENKMERNINLLIVVNVALFTVMMIYLIYKLPY